jgi:hypothetical protein
LDTVPAASGKKPVSAVKAPVAVEAGLAPKSEGRQRSGGWTTGDSAATIKVTTRSETVSALVAPVVSTTSVTERSASVRAASSVTQMSAPVAAITPVTDIRTQVAATIAPVTTIKISSSATIAPATTVKTPVAATIAPVTTIKTPVAAVVDPETGITGPTAAPEATEPTAPAPPVVENDLMKGIITDLEAKGIIQGVEPLSFRLDKHGMTVNGVKVSEEVFTFFKDKYVTNPRNRFSYSHEGGTTSSTVWVY